MIGCSKRFRFLLCIFASPLYAGDILPVKLCAEDLAIKPPFVGNSEVPSTEYSGTTWRNLQEIGELLGEPFRHYLESLAPTDPIVLSGGGYGIYGLELAQKGHPVLMINPQHFYFDTLVPFFEEGRVPIEYRNGEPVEILSIHHVKPFVLNRLGLALGVSPPSCLVPSKLSPPPYEVPETWQLQPGQDLRSVAGEIQGWVARILMKLNPPNKKTNQSVLYDPQGTGRVSLIESIFQKVSVDKIRQETNGGAVLHIDYMDAYTYSSKKLDLILQIYAALRPRGRAYIQVPDSDDQVHLTRPDSLGRFANAARDPDTGRFTVSLTDYLLEYVPQFGSYPTTTPFPMRVLVLQKKEDGDDLHWLKDRIAEEKLKIVQFTPTLQFPLASYEEKP